MEILDRLCRTSPVGRLVTVAGLFALAIGIGTGNSWPWAAMAFVPLLLALALAGTLPARQPVAAEKDETA